MTNRPRRLRGSEQLRKMVRETRLSPDSLILPIFLEEGCNIKTPIDSLEGHYRYSPDMVFDCVDRAMSSGVSRFILFGIPKNKDELGTSAYDENGIVQEGIIKLREEYKDKIYLVSDVCMCEYTSHGHCGIIENQNVNNDKTLDYLSKIAISHAKAGVDMVAPSDMMDGRIAHMRSSLDNSGFSDLPIMSYAVKYSSSFYGPFREAAGSAPSFGDRKTYQMDYHNKREALKEAMLDVSEGADILMVKPALSYLDIISKVAESTTLPVAAYSVSGEYAMIKAASKMGLLDEYGTMCESAVSIFRSGADILISYYANELARAIMKGDIG